MSDSVRSKPRVKVKPRRRDTVQPRIRTLSCFREVHERLCRGWPAQEVARFIQEDRKEYLGIKRSSLEVIVRNYQKTIPPGEMVQNTIPSVIVDASRAVREGFDELAELQKLYDLQMCRIGIDFALEQKTGKLLNSMSREIKGAKDILVAIGDLKMDLGLNDRHLGKVEVENSSTVEVAGKYGKDSVGKVLSNPESRQRLLDIANKFLKASNEEINGSEDEDSDAIKLEYCGKET